MKKRICILLFNLFLSLFVFAKTTNLEEALRQKWVSATVVMQDDAVSSKRGLHLLLKSLIKEDLLVTVPVGFVFQAQDSSFQDFIHLEKKDLPVPALAVQGLFLKASCIRANRRSPPNGTNFLATTLASSNLLALATFAFQQNLYNNGSMQSALWAISNDHDLAGIYDIELAKFVAQRLNKPLPDYRINYNYRDLPGETAANTLEPLRIQGVFHYALTSDQQVKLDLIDAAGKSVLANFGMAEAMSSKKGRHKFTFELQLKGIERGTYFVKLTTVKDSSELASKEVVF